MVLLLPISEQIACRVPIPPAPLSYTEPHKPITIARIWMPNCVICSRPDAKVQSPYRGDRREWACNWCGVFVLTGTAEAEMRSILEEHPGAALILSYTLRRRNPKLAQDTTPLSGDDLRQLVERQRLPDPAEQCDLLIAHLGARTALGGYERIETPEILTTVGVSTNEAIRALVQHLDEIRAIDVNGGPKAYQQQDIQIRLTVTGWTKFRAIQTRGAETRNAIMAMEFEEPHVDRAFREAFAPAANDCGFILMPLNERQGAGLIDDQLRVRIRSCAFVVADVTTSNLGAYWEAGFAEGLLKPVIYTCEVAAFAEGASHFDTNHHLTVPWALANLDDARRRLAATIRATLPELAR